MNTNLKDINQLFKQTTADSNCRLLLHVCCAPCLAAALDKLKGTDTTCLYFNPNIMPRDEWIKRKEEVEKLINLATSGAFGTGYEKLKLVVLDEGESQFLKSIRGKEHLGEHSARCISCFTLRLSRAYNYAKEHGYTHFATTLTSSPHKDAVAINQIGNTIGGNFYISSDFKKEDGQLKSRQICLKYNIYRQSYCGCAFSSQKIEQPFFIGNVKVPNRMLLAPMAGYTDVGMRYVCKLCGAGLTYTEMVSSRGLVYDSQKTKTLLETTDIETPKAVQIFGSDAKVMAKAATHPYLEKFDIIDINMGCPMPKIVKNGDGSALMDNPKKAKEIIEAVVAATKKPVTVKFRKAENAEDTISFAKMCEAAGASSITVHGRTRAQLYGGESDTDIIKQVAESVSIPVILSGDILSRAQAEEILKTSQIAAVMVGRAAVGNPCIFGKEITAKEAICMQIDKAAAVLGERQVMLDIKKHLVCYFKGVKDATKVRKLLLEKNSIKELKDTIYKLEKEFI